ncbi:MAG: DUF4349 domain-containing protein [Nannocystaceae bacterium]
MKRPLIAALALLLLAVGGAGCAKMSPSESSSYPGGYGEAAGAADYESDAEYSKKSYDAMEEAPMAPPAAEPQPTTLSRREIAAGPAGGLAPGGQGVPEKSAPKRPATPGKDEAAADNGGGSEVKEDSEPQKPVARQIIYTAEMALSVFNLEDAMQRVEQIALAAGGYVQSMSAGYYVVRIPAANLRSVMNGVGGLGLVTSRSLQARDVTEEYVDLNTRIRVLRETQLQLIDLLKKAKTVEEALHVRQALDQVTMELEQALGRLRMLESLIGFSTLTVRLEERGPQNRIPSSNDPFPWVDELGVEATEWN